MKPSRFLPFLPIFLLLVLTGLACGLSGSGVAAPVETATASLVPSTPTKTPRPTSTPRPTATPNVAATQKADEFNSLLTEFKEKDYVTTTDGKFSELDPFKEEWAQLGWYNYYPPYIETEDFVFSGHFNWSTANEQTDLSGCGIVFGAQENGDHYVIFLDKSRILFLMTRGSNAYNVGKTSGSGKANFSIPAEADFILAVKGQTAYVSVDGEVTEYTLSVDQTSAGTFAFSILSGTNKDYGTSCEMTDMIFWEPK
jgi:hypothetical protein